MSALSNLMAASGVPVDDAPILTEQLGTTHIGEFGIWQYNYREAATEDGWLTAVELLSTEPPKAQGGSD